MNFDWKMAFQQTLNTGYASKYWNTGWYFGNTMNTFVIYLSLVASSLSCASFSVASSPILNLYHTRPPKAFCSWHRTTQYFLVSPNCLWICPLLAHFLSKPWKSKRFSSFAWSKWFCRSSHLTTNKQRENDFKASYKTSSGIDIASDSLSRDFFYGPALVQQVKLWLKQPMVFVAFFTFRLNIDQTSNQWCKLTYFFQWKMK